MMKYYHLWDDMRIKGRWHLSGPVDEHGAPMDPWQFKQGRRLELTSRPVFRMARQGHPLDFTLTGFTIPLVYWSVVQVLERLDLKDEIQLIPASVEGHDEAYFVVNALELIRCIDDARCEEVEYWTPEDGEPDRVGQYQKVRGLKIDPARVGATNIFRPWGWTGPLIISERVKAALEDEDTTGPSFVEV